MELNSIKCVPYSDKKKWTQPEIEETTERSDIFSFFYDEGDKTVKLPGWVLESSSMKILIK